ncbi:MAG: undecaprenyl-diphosphate phosphatase [Clostridia bacterium]|nr:undecaprenyl-diphosphate phosphatase [Clostridia bacterium]
MQILYAIILGLVQGLTEFLPVSSSGHLLLLEKLGIGEPDVFFNVMLHAGTLVAVLIALFKDWSPIVRHPFQKTTGMLFVACLPTLAIALLFKFLFPSLLDGKMLGFGFVLTAALLFVGENFQIAQNKVLSYKNTVLSGVLQGIAVLPGVSRSGATISCLTFLGVDKKSAARFSFLLSIPAILASCAVEIFELVKGGISLTLPWYCILIGTLVAFVSGLVSIKFFLKLIERHSMLIFVVYTAVLGLVVSVLPLFVAI